VTGSDTVVAEQKAHWEGDHARRRGWNHPSVRALFEPRAEFIAAFAKGDRRMSVLDVGCGNGFLTLPLERLFDRVVGVDFARAMLDINPAQEKQQADATALPFGDASFDLVVSSHMLHHMPEEQQGRAVNEMARVAKHGVVIWEPNRNNPAMWLFGRLVPHERELLKFSPGRLGTLLREAGLPTVRLRAEGLITPNLCPAALAPMAQAAGRTPLRMMGMYVRGVAWRDGAPLDVSALTR